MLFEEVSELQNAIEYIINEGESRERIDDRVSGKGNRAYTRMVSCSKLYLSS